jgi:hypothetical protein
MFYEIFKRWGSHRHVDSTIKACQTLKHLYNGQLFNKCHLGFSLIVGSAMFKTVPFLQLSHYLFELASNYEGFVLLDIRHEAQVIRYEIHVPHGRRNL